MKKLGEKEWAALTEKKRQRRIKQIKQKEKKLRRQGKYDDVAKLFQNLFVLSRLRKAYFERKIICTVHSLQTLKFLNYLSLTDKAVSTLLKFCTSFFNHTYWFLAIVNVNIVGDWPHLLLWCSMLSTCSIVKNFELFLLFRCLPIATFNANYYNIGYAFISQQKSYFLL